MITPSEMLAVLPDVDVVVVAAPATADTQHLVNAEFLAAMRESALLINVARGALVDEVALVAALDAGRPAHAVLDVTDIEPLPPESPLWTHPKVTVTPHVSGGGEGRFRRAADVFAANLARYRTGRHPGRRGVRPSDCTMSEPMRGKVAIVSGVGPGLGRAIALGLADAGARVVLAARTDASIDPVMDELAARGHRSGRGEGRRHGRSRSRADRRSCDRRVGRARRAREQRVQHGADGTAIDITDDEWRAVLEVNVIGTVGLSVEAARWMVEHGGGSIVMVNSQAARRGAARRGPYAASKAALLLGRAGARHRAGPERDPRELGGARADLG